MRIIDNIKTGFCNTGRVLGTIGYECTVGFAKKVYQLTPRDLSGLYSTNGFEKVSKFGASALRFIPTAARVSNLVSDSKALDTLLTPARTYAENHKDFVYSVMWIDSVSTWIKKDKETGKYKLVAPVDKDGRTFTLQMYTYGNIIEGLRFIHLNVWPVETISNISKALGKWEIYGIKPCDYPLFSSLTFNPKDIFLFFGYGVRFGWFVIDCAKSANIDALKKQFSLDNLIEKVISPLGKMTLICFGKFHFNKTWFQFIAFAVDFVSLMNVMFKKNKEVADRKDRLVPIKNRTSQT